MLCKDEQSSWLFDFQFAGLLWKTPAYSRWILHQRAIERQKKTTYHRTVKHDYISKWNQKKTIEQTFTFQKKLF